MEIALTRATAESQLQYQAGRNCTDTYELF